MSRTQDKLPFGERNLIKERRFHLSCGNIPHSEALKESCDSTGSWLALSASGALRICFPRRMVPGTSRFAFAARPGTDSWENYSIAFTV